MEEQKKDQMHNGATCGGWCGCGHRHLILRWILGIVILTFVFAFGMKLGEIKAALEYGDYGYMGYPHHMMDRGYYAVYPEVPMMQGQNSGAAGVPKASTSAQ